MTKPVRRLLPLFAPAHYALQLNISKRSERLFDGTATITGELKATGQEIILHAKDLAPISATIDDKQATVTVVEADDELIISASAPLEAGEHTVTISFSGKITDPMHGLYPCYFKIEGKDKELLMTQLESHHAREVFPCVDEPAAKATFDLTLQSESGITVLGNTPIQEQAEKDGVLTTTFETTPQMSTYLLAFVAGELGYLEATNKHGVTIRTYATPDKVEFTRFALDFAVDVLDYFDDYFGVPYPLPKCDLVAVPDFSAGAMENWGLTTYRESCMLVDPENTAADTKEWIAAVVAHELSHQWFGNLVTMQWWDDLWLNESFAKWMEHYAVDHLRPEWQVWEQFGGSEQQYAFGRDSLANVQAVKQPVNHPDELHSLFDAAIVYAKGSCLIRMLHEYLGADTFRDGLRVYMKRHQYQNTEANDLWAALSEVSGKDVAAFMDPWLYQPGHPVLNANIEGDAATLSQKRFYANPLEAKDAKQTLWPLPLLSEQMGEESLETAHATVAVRGNNTVQLNRGYTSFYHTQYDPEHLQKLAKAAETKQLAVVDRLGLLADNLALVKAGLASTADLVKLAGSYKNEDAYPVWQSIIGVIGALRLLVNEDPDLKPHLQRYIRDVIKREYDRLGWERIEGEAYFDELLRPSMLSLMAYAELPEAVERALKIFDEAEKPEDIMADIRSIVYAVASRERGESAYERLLQWYKETTSAEERINIAAGITATRDEKLAKTITGHFTTKLIKSQDLFYWFIYLIRNRHGRMAAWDWMQTHWDWIIEQYKGGHDYADFPKYAASAMSTRDQLEMYRAFFEPKLAEIELERTIRQGLEDIEVRVLWRERDIDELSKLLKKL